MLYITPDIELSEKEITFSAIRAQGAGGQNVNKVSSAIQLRFDICNSSLPERYKERLLALSDRRISNDGVLVIKAQSFRTQEKNREDALQRLRQIILQAGHQARKRTPTRPSRVARQKRLDAKVRRGRLKSMRTKVKIE